MCEYCNPPNKTGWDDLSKNLLGYDEEEIHIAINADGELEIDLEIETSQWDSYLDGFINEKRHKNIKINYCPMCGRKLKHQKISESECEHKNYEETHPYGWIACKDCGKLLL